MVIFQRSLFNYFGTIYGCLTDCWKLIEKKLQDDRPAPDILRPITKFLINFANISKNENIVLNLVFKSSPQTSIPPLLSTIFGITNLSGLRSKVLNSRHISESPSEISKQSCEILIVEIQPVVLEKMSLTRERPLQVPLLPPSAYEITNAGDTFRNKFIE